MHSAADIESLQALAPELASQHLPAGWAMVGSSVNARVAVQAEMGIYYKEFLPRGPLETLKATVRGSRATRALSNNDALTEAGFNAPANLAWGKLSGNREYLFSSAVAGKSVTDWLRQELSGRPGEALKRRRTMLYSLGTFIGRLHRAGFIHGDLRTSNVLASLEHDQFHFALIDNERNQRKTPPPGRGMLRNLMQLNMLLPAELSKSDRMRFFSNWRREMPELSEAEARLLGLEAYHWAMRRLGAKGKL